MVATSNFKEMLKPAGRSVNMLMILYIYSKLNLIIINYYESSVNSHNNL